MIIIIKCLDGAQASGLQHLADEINKGAFGKHTGNKHERITDAGGVPASLIIVSFPFCQLRDFPEESPAAHEGTHSTARRLLGQAGPITKGTQPSWCGKRDNNLH